MSTGISTARRAAPLAVLFVMLLTAACGSSSSSSSSSAVSVAAPPTGTGVGQPSPFLGANLSDVGCGSTQLCAAVGTSFDPEPTSATVAISADGGLSWAKSTGITPPSTNFLSTTCAAKICMTIGRSLLGGLVYVSHGHGVAWTSTAKVQADSIADAVGCAGRSWCLVVSADSTHVFASTSVDGGASWTLGGALPTGTGLVQHLECATSSSCIASGTTVNGGPQLTVTNDGGRTWTVASIPSSPAVLGVLDASCRILGAVCLAVAQTTTAGATTLLESSDGGATFTAPTAAISQPAGPVGVSCVATTCIVVGRDAKGAGAAVELVGSAGPRGLKLSYTPTQLLAVSCSSAARCVAASASSLVVLSPSVPQRRQQQSR
jgi:hypothetical protein